MKKVLITGACGQIGTELAVFLGDKELSKEAVIASDIQKPQDAIKENATFIYLDVLDFNQLSKTVVEMEIDTIFHLAAVLSASGEQDPMRAYEINMQGLMNVLEVSRRQKIKKVIVPSSIAVFGPDAPKENTPDDAPLNPTTMYGVTKVAAEKLLNYYFMKYGLDTRSLRYPGIISSEQIPGGGTTDFAVDLYLQAVKARKAGEPLYQCFVREDTRLPFMYMSDAVGAIVKLAQAQPHWIKGTRTYNVHAMTLTPAEIVDSIRSFHHSEFECEYKPDQRQAIADSWPYSLDDHLAREHWGWESRVSLKIMTDNMIRHLHQKMYNFKIIPEDG